MDNNKTKNKELTPEESKELLIVLENRYMKNIKRHEDLDWNKIAIRLKSDSAKLWSLNEMERTGGEPDVVEYDKTSDEYIFFDCSVESPAGRRSFCYDREALDSRKEHKPANNVMDLAADMGLELLSEEQYRRLQTLGDFDLKTSSWVMTPVSIRRLGGAIFCDRRYNTVWVYHNGAESYYSARGFRCSLSI